MLLRGLMLLGCVLYTASASAQMLKQIALDVPTNATTHRTIQIMRGTELVLHGNIPADLGTFTISLRQGRDVIAQVVRYGRWRLAWDSGRFTGHQADLSVYLSKDSLRVTCIYRLGVDVFDTPPVFLVVTPPAESAPATAVIRAASRTNNELPVKLALDGRSLEPPDADGNVKVDVSAMPTGHHLVTGTVDMGGIPADLTPVELNLPSRIRMSGVMPVVSRYHRMPVQCTADPGVNLTSVTYLLDGQPAARAAVPPFPARIDLQKLDDGVHRIYAVGQSDTGAVLSAETQFRVNAAEDGAGLNSAGRAADLLALAGGGDAPVRLDAWQRAFRASIAGHRDHIALLRSLLQTKRYTGSDSVARAIVACKRMDAEAANLRQKLHMVPLPTAPVSEERLLASALHRLGDSLQAAAQAAREIHAALRPLAERGGSFAAQPGALKIRTGAALRAAARQVGAAGSLAESAGAMDRQVKSQE